MSSISASNAENEKHTEIDTEKHNFNRTTIRVGTRKSELAIVQTNHVISLLQKIYPNRTFEIHKMTTVGDRVLNIALPKIGEKSLFTKDLEDALKNGTVDFVVHSLKDLPTALPSGMTIGAVLEREDPRDSLVLARHYEGKCLRSLPEGSIIGTSSLRRTAQISRLYPHLKVHDIRGNLNTRLAKLDAVDSKYAGIVLAQAGLLRLGWQKRINQIIEPNEMLYAVGQGALAVECRTYDKEILEMLQTLVCPQTQFRILAERSFLKTLGGGCSAPVAVHSTLVKKKHTDIAETNEYELSIIGSVWSLDGNTSIQAESVCNLVIIENNHLPIEVNQAADEEDAVPLKKLKVQINSKVIDDLKKRNQPSPPEIIDHPQLEFKLDDHLKKNLPMSGMDLNDANNDELKKCPYAALFSTSKSINTGETQGRTNSGESSKCPLNFRIGEDVMGQCPYFDSADNNQMLLKSSSSCDNRSNRNEVVNSENNIAGNQYKYANSSNASNLDGILKKTNEKDVDDPTDVYADRPLFCGIYPHRRWSIEIYEQCEQLGENLANVLIEKGAISVMAHAQNEIRNNI